jgi:phosphoribosyl-ATP pyrophosphohydrolase
MSVLQQLMATIQDRKVQAPPRSYTTQLLVAGVERIGEKLLEEAREVVDAAGEPASAAAHSHVIHEAADVVYHLFVLLAHQNVSLNEVEAELERRFGVSGLDEKAARKQ